MRNHVTFTTGRLNQTDVKPHFINDCCFGEDCIAWLITELRSKGWSDLTEPWQEDWGWQTSGVRNGRRYLLSISLVPEDEPEWLVHITERAPLFDRLRGRAALTVVPALAPAIHDVLRAAPDIQKVTWFDEEALRRGESTGASMPDAPPGGSERPA